MIINNFDLVDLFLSFLSREVEKELSKFPKYWEVENFSYRKFAERIYCQINTKYDFESLSIFTEDPIYSSELKNLLISEIEKLIYENEY